MGQKKTSVSFLSLTFLVSMMFFQNCYEGLPFRDDTYLDPPLLEIPCEEKGYNACVINKNSVYSKMIVSTLSGPDYDNLPLMAVNLPFLHDLELLQNDTFRIRSYTGDQVDTGSLPLKFTYESDQGVSLSQVTSYYYSSLAMSFSQTTPLSLMNQRLYIITQAPVTGWSSEDNTIYLGLNPVTQHDSGLDASMLLNLIGEANIYYASQGAIYKETDQRHRDCREEKQMCCTHIEGCSKAITMGFIPLLFVLLF